MAAVLPFLILCGVALMQECIADQPVSTITEISQTTENTKPNLPNPTSSSSFLEMHEQFDIIGLCTELPREYNLILKNYLKLSNSSSEMDTRIFQEEIEKLKNESNHLKTYVNSYAKAVQQMDPKSDSVRQQMVSGANGLSQSLGKLYENLVNNPQMSRTDKIAFVQNDIIQAITDFEEACVDQTIDILDNVKEDLENRG